MHDIEDLDKEETTVFNPAQWIGCGRKFKDVPRYVCDVLNDLRKIPDKEYRTYIPRPELPIQIFIDLELPKQSAEVFTTRASDCFSSNPLDEDAYKLLATRSIPPKAVLDEMEKDIGQEWFKGRVSITDPRYNGGKDRLPLSALTYWQLVYKIVSAQREWRQARGWIQGEVRRETTASEFPCLDGIFETYGWDAPLAGHTSITSRVLAQLLSNNMLTDDIMYLMVNHLRNRLQQCPNLTSSTIIAPSLFYAAIEQAAKANRFNLRALRAMEDLVKQERRQFLWIPVFYQR
jgi:hypothetical protein